jgi:ankyrin repeat protein
MLNIPADDSRAVAVTSAIQIGDVAQLQRLFEENPDLATARIIDAKGSGRTLLHIAADWPGHFPNGAQTVATLIAAGADPNAPMIGPHSETPLHWAASSDDVDVLDALLDGGADIESPGAIFTGGAPMSDAVVFAQWNAARRLLARGADLSWMGYNDQTPLDAAEHSDNDDLIAWLKSQGARSGTASGSDGVGP